MRRSTLIYLLAAMAVTLFLAVAGIGRAAGALLGRLAVGSHEPGFWAFTSGGRHSVIPLGPPGVTWDAIVTPLVLGLMGLAVYVVHRRVFRRHLDRDEVPPLNLVYLQAVSAAMLLLMLLGATDVVIGVGRILLAPEPARGLVLLEPGAPMFEPDVGTLQTLSGITLLIAAGSVLLFHLTRASEQGGET